MDKDIVLQAVSEFVVYYEHVTTQAFKTKYTRKYLLYGYILGVLTHTTAWDQHWGGDETLKLVLVYFA